MIITHLVSFFTFPAAPPPCPYTPRKPEEAEPRHGRVEVRFGTRRRVDRIASTARRAGVSMGTRRTVDHGQYLPRKPDSCE